MGFAALWVQERHVVQHNGGFWGRVNRGYDPTIFAAGVRYVCPKAAKEHSQWLMVSRSSVGVLPSFRTVAVVNCG